jgi:hypothetical protein
MGGLFLKYRRNAACDLEPIPKAVRPLWGNPFGQAAKGRQTSKGSDPFSIASWQCCPLKNQYNTGEIACEAVSGVVE